MENKRKVCIITLGCKVNQYESNSIAKLLSEANFSVCFSIQPADAYIVNTCAVTNEAERKSRGILSKISKVSLDAPIYIRGCSSQNDYTKFLGNKNVRCVYGTSSKLDLVEKIINHFKNEDNNASTVDINTEICSFYQDEYMAKGERTRAVIKIQDGCNNFCSYCIIPYLRGRERSRPLESIKDEVEYQSKFSNEIVFTGINLSSYGKDFKEKKSLIDVVKLMRNYPNIRFRFSSLEQDIITEEFLKELKQTPNFAPHFHLSLQSGCDSTLKYMNRKYTTEMYYNKLLLIRSHFNNPAITTDVIVGFPTETEENFNETYKFLKKCNFAKMHIFPYSKRSGTVASKMKNLATHVKERCEKLAQLDDKMHQDYIISCQDKTYKVIIEREHEGYFEGHTENYIKCYIESDIKLNQNQILSVKILKPYKDGAIAKVLSY